MMRVSPQLRGLPGEAETAHSAPGCAVRQFLVASISLSCRARSSVLIQPDVSTGLRAALPSAIPRA